MTRRYLVEGWRGLDCVAFRRCMLPRVAVREADHYAADLGADRVYIRRVDTGDNAVGGLMADRDAAGWRRVDDPALAEIIEGGDR